MKPFTLTTIGTVAAVLAFSTGCSQSKIDALNTDLDNAYTNLFEVEIELDKAKKELNEVEMERNLAQGQAESAMAALSQAKQELAQQKQYADLKMAEYEAFVAKTAQALAAKDKKISELSAPVK